jgi:pimeloyl-ACP methyl ester carboxylesterase
MLESIKSVIIKENIKECILIGNSLGGFIATRFASKWPKLVAGLVLLSPAGAPLKIEAYFFCKFHKIHF